MPLANPVAVGSRNDVEHPADRRATRRHIGSDARCRNREGDGSGKRGRPDGRITPQPSVSRKCRDRQVLDPRSRLISFPTWPGARLGRRSNRSLSVTCPLDRPPGCGATGRKTQRRGQGDDRRVESRSRPRAGVHGPEGRPAPCRRQRILIGLRRRPWPTE